jgi:insulysin
MAGLGYGISPSTTGLVLSLSGYNDRISVFCKHVVEKLAGLLVNPERLEVMKEQVWNGKTFVFCNSLHAPCAA